MEAFFLALVTKFPVIGIIVSAIGILRIAVVPLMTILHKEAAQIGSAKMEAGLVAIEQNKIYTTFLYVLNWFASIKVQATVAVPATVVAAAPVASTTAATDAPKAA